MQKSRELGDNVIGRGAAPTVLNIVEILDGDRLAVVLFYSDGNLLLGEIQLFATFRDEFPEAGHTGR